MHYQHVGVVVSPVPQPVPPPLLLVVRVAVHVVGVGLGRVPFLKKRKQIYYHYVGNRRVVFNSLHDGDVPGVRDAVAPLVAAAEDVGDLIQEIQTQLYFIY